MLAPGMTITGAQIVTTASAGQVPDYLSQGIGFMNDGSLALDTDTPDGSTYRAGIRQNADGAFYVTTDTDGSDVWIGGLRVSALGQLVAAEDTATIYVNGNPLASTGALAVSDATGAPPGDPYWADVGFLFHFDGTNGGTTFVDEKGNTVGVQAAGATTSTTDPKFGTAKMLLGGTSGVNIRGAGVAANYPSDIPSSTPFTIEGWLNPSVLPGPTTQFWGAGANGAGSFFYLSLDSTGAVIFYRSLARITATTLITAGSWSHIALTRDASNVCRLFINGILQGTTYTVSTGIGAVATTEQSVGAGFYGATAPVVAGGYDDWRYTKGVCRYTATFTPPTEAFPNS